jgi:hypothetical protein
MTNDIKILRELAAKYYELATREDNYRNMELHRAANDMKPGARPVVLLGEFPWGELQPAEELTPVCEDSILRGVETKIRQTLFQKKYFPGDMVIPPFIAVRKIVDDETRGSLVPILAEADQHSAHTVRAHQYTTQFHSMDDIEKIKFSRLSYDRHSTMRNYERVADAIGDIVPVKLYGMHAFMGIQSAPWDLLARYMSLDELLYNMYDEPELMHAIISRFTDVFLDRVAQFEALDLLEADYFDIHCTPALTNDLHPDRSHVTLYQVWARATAQILGVVSPEMTDEFDITYQIKAMKPFGLVYYGCCEPLDQKIDILSKIPNLRKITVTPWADVNVACEAIAGRYVVSAKPNPGFMANSAGLDMDIVEGELHSIVDACHRYNCTSDIVMKDISTVGGRTENLIEWERAAMRIARKYE